MKRLFITIIIAAFTISSKAQNDKLMFPTAENPNLAGQYIVIDSKGTSEENYNKVIQYINTTYENPTEVIKADIKGKYVRMEWYTTKLYRNLNFDLDGTCQLEFNFKEDKIKLTYLSSNNGVMDLNFTYPKMYKKNGKPKKERIKYNKNVVEGLNLAIQGVIKESTKVGAEDNW